MVIAQGWGRDEEMGRYLLVNGRGLSVLSWVGSREVRYSKMTIVNNTVYLQLRD